MNKKNQDILIYLSKVILIILLIVFVLRCFFFETYSISTSQMESSLIKGDEVIVDKTAYGPRLPITVLSIPFTFDSFLGLKSYSTTFRLPYMRPFSSRVSRNDIVLFNSPLEIEKPIDKRNLLISRCVAVPGDTIIIQNSTYYINGSQYAYSPSQVDEYSVYYSDYDRIYNVCDSLDLMITPLRDSNDTIYFSMNRYDAFVLGRNVTRGVFDINSEVILQDFMFIAPSTTTSVLLTPNNIKIYRQIIEYEQGSRVEIVDDAVYLSGEKVDVYHFRDDYYWMLSDNTIEGIDSRTLGFIPFKNVVGRVSSILYSYGTGFRIDRCLSAVE